ncbi:MAG: tetratricopeptide repeat protein [Paludibacteraceae bacterium]|nr:tetratricopeptide repeat protein [Paludibacteraceae bacterium]
MRRTFLLIATIISGIGVLKADFAALPQFEQGNQVYAAGEYAEAAELYEQCLSSVTESERLTRKSKAKVYYNLGNARFKQGELAQSILAYERCLRLDPRHKDAKYNLEIAHGRITDNLTDNTSFFFSTWFRSVRDMLPEGTWTWMSILLFVLSLAGALLFAMSGQVVVRKTAFHSTWVALIISIIAVCNAGSLHNRDTERAEAIITQGVLNAKSSPDRSGTELFTLHEGTKVTITEELGEWCNIRVGNNEGWVEKGHLVRI